MTSTARPAAPAGPEGPKRSHAVRIAAGVVGVVMVLLVAMLYVSRTSDGGGGESPVVGGQAPALDGRAYLGDRFDIGLNDRWLVVNFFATWCTPCVQEHPELVAFDREHAAKGDARVISIVYDDKPETVREFFEERGGTWTVLDADNGRTALDWGVAKIPESFLVTADGIVVERFQSGVTRAELNRYIEAYDEARAEATGGTGTSGAGS